MGDPFFEKRKRAELSLQWLGRFDTLAELVRPYDELFSIAKDSEDVGAALEILQASGNINDVMIQASHFPYAMDRFFFEKLVRARNPKEKKQVRRDRDEEYARIDVRVRGLMDNNQLAGALFSEMGLIANALHIAHDIDIGDISGYGNAIAQIQHNPISEPQKRFLIHALYLHRFFHDERKHIPKTPVPVDPKRTEEIEIFTLADYEGTYKKNTVLFGKPAECTVRARYDQHPFLFGQGQIVIGNSGLLVFNISRLNGELLLDAGRIARASGIIQHPQAEQQIKNMLWGVILEAIQVGAFKEQLTQPQHTQRESGRQSQPMQQIITNEPGEAQVGESEMPAEDETRIVPVIDLASQQTMEAPTLDDGRLYIPPLNYRQFTHALVRCKARIVPGGKHLQVEYKGRSTPMFNRHGQHRKFYGSEIHEKLVALGIPPEEFLKKI